MLQWLKKFFRWTCHVFLWLMEPEPKRFYLYVGAFFLPLFYGILISAFFNVPWDQRIGTAGLFYQLSGIATVAIGLHETRKLFRRPSLWELLKDFWNRRPKLHPVSNSLTGHGGGSSGGRASLSLNLPPPDSSLPQEERLQWAIDQIVNLFNNNQTQIRQTQERFERYENDLKGERQERQTGDDTVRRLLEEALAGGIHLEAFGVLCLIFGAFLSTYPSWIASWIHN